MPPPANPTVSFDIGIIVTQLGVVITLPMTVSVSAKFLIPSSDAFIISLISDILKYSLYSVFHYIV